MDEMHIWIIAWPHQTHLIPEHLVTSFWKNRDFVTLFSAKFHLGGEVLNDFGVLISQGNADGSHASRKEGSWGGERSGRIDGGVVDEEFAHVHVTRRAAVEKVMQRLIPAFLALPLPLLQEETLQSCVP
jgi:hypothetical protein